MRIGRILFVLLLFLAVPGCAINYNIPERYQPAGTAGLQAHKLPLKAGIVVPAEEFSVTRTWVNPQMESVTLTMTLPVGAYQGKTSRAIFPALFETVEYIKGKPYPPGLDIICVPVITDLSFEYAPAGGFKQGYTMKLTLSSTILDAAGVRIFKDEVTTTTNVVLGMVATEKADQENWAAVFSQAMNQVFLKAAAEIGSAREVQTLAAGKSGYARPVVPQGEPAATLAPVPGRSGVPEAARTKLKKALENGAISAEQLGKAMEELERNEPSKLLRSFLSNELTDKQFGELY